MLRNRFIMTFIHVDSKGTKNSGCGLLPNKLKADSHIACRAHAVPLSCRAARGLECVFPI
jgi:hypothetical protein